MKKNYVLVLLISMAVSLSTAQNFPGGIIESSKANVVRPGFDSSQIASFISQRGLFTFPAPFNTQGIRITNQSDCPIGYKDCITPVEYSYYRNMNNHVNDDSIIIALKMLYGQWDERITLFSYNKNSDKVNKLGSLFNGYTSLGNPSTFYFSATQPYMLYVKFWSGLARINVKTLKIDTVFDIKKKPIQGLTTSDKYIWQPHTSDNDLMHSFTLRQDVNYNVIGSAVYDELKDTVYYFPQTPCYLDECQIDKSGKWLVIKEDQCDPNPQFDGRIIDLQTMKQTKILNVDSNHIGHSDNGWGYAVGADNALNTPSVMLLMLFTVL